MVGHIAPEAVRGGPIGLIRDGEQITLDVDARRLDVDVSEDELEQRAQDYRPPDRPAAGVALTKYAKLVSSAALGAVTA
jgi:dihydroxy-acid dehydratase